MTWGIAYRYLPSRPATRGGRVAAHPQVFTSREAAERKIAEIPGNAGDWLHAVVIR
jgi:hypothetical protein